MLEWIAPAVVATVWNAGAVSLGGMALYYLMLKRGTAARATANFYLVPGTAALLAWALAGRTGVGADGVRADHLVGRMLDGKPPGCLGRCQPDWSSADRPAVYLTANCVLPNMISRSASVIFPLALLLQQHRHASLDRRARRHRIVPTLHIRILVQVDVAALGIAYPGKRDDVRHAVFFARQPRRLAQPLVQHPMEPRDLVGISIDRVQVSSRPRSSRSDYTDRTSGRRRPSGTSSIPGTCSGRPDHSESAFRPSSPTDRS